MRQLWQVGMHQRGDFISVWTDPYPTEPMANRLPLNTTGVSVNWHDRGVETVNDYARQSWLRWRPPDVFITMYGLWLFDCAFQDIVCFRDESVSCFLSQPSPVFCFVKVACGLIRYWRFTRTGVWPVSSLIDTFMLERTIRWGHIRWGHLIVLSE